MPEAYSIPIKELAARMAAKGSAGLPDELRTDRHLICNTPAAIDFNSPGAQGFGVKRAGLTIPGSIMLLVSPACCGRNTAALQGEGHYGERFAYLELDENDIVTGRHLAKIPAAVRAFAESREEVPSVVLICLTCVDALLGTDMERVCRKAEKTAGLPVRPCYMYALTRESIRPPMIAVRETIYGLLEPRKKRPAQANLMGFFSPVAENSELRAFLRQAGIRKIGELASCHAYADFQELAAANFNLVLSEEASSAALQLEKRLGIPSIRLQRLYEIDKISRQYQALSKIIGASPALTALADCRQRAEAAVHDFCQQHDDAVIAIGSRVNANPFELALAFVRCGLTVREIFALPSTADSFYIKRLAELSPATRIYSNLEPTILYYEEDTSVTLALGADACTYHPQAQKLPWNELVQPFGYQAVESLFHAMTKAMDHDAAVPLLIKDSLTDAKRPVTDGCREKQDAAAETASYPQAVFLAKILAKETEAAEKNEKLPTGLSLALPPFAPDTAGAASVLFPLGGLTVIVDAGGCAGNICGFDEPRWQREDLEKRYPAAKYPHRQNVPAVFSAGLRDMDAIMGRDDKLVEKIADAAEKIPAKFVGLVSTPVPAVIATDFRALCRMIENKTGLPAIAAETDGTHLYDEGAGKAYLALLKKFATPSADKVNRVNTLQSGKRQGGEEQHDEKSQPDKVGVLGLTPLDFSPAAEKSLRAAVTAAAEKTGSKAVFFDRLADFCQAGSLQKVMVVSPSGLKAARFLQRRCDIPIETELPRRFLQDSCHDILQKVRDAVKAQPQKSISILIVQQQILANNLRRAILAELGHDDTCVHVGSFFAMDKQLQENGDCHFKGERDFFAYLQARPEAIVLGDKILRRALPPEFTGTFIKLPHFALSGHYE